MRKLEIGTYTEWHPEPGSEGESAALLEEQGFDVAIYPDSQNLFPEAFVRMALAVPRTSRIRLAPSVINPVTRHPAIAASAAAAIHRESGGRAILGIGRGDSALATVGESYPAGLDRFTRYVGDVRGYLHGKPVDCNGFASNLRWLTDELPPVEIDIACSGERVIRSAVRLADRVTFAVGSATERLAWAIGVARDELDRQGRDARKVTFGAFVCVGAHADRAVARQVVQGAVATHAVFPTLGRPSDAPAGAEHGGIPGDVLAAMAKASKLSGAGEAVALPDAFVDWFAVTGPPDEVADRLREIAALGLSHLYLVSHAPSTDPRVARECRETFVTEVMPRLRR